MIHLIVQNVPDGEGDGGGGGLELCSPKIFKYLEVESRHDFSSLLTASTTCIEMTAQLRYISKYTVNLTHL